jgi:hypothetical protein
VSNGYNFNIVAKEADGNVSTTRANTGYRTAGWIGSTGFQIVGCQTVSSADGSIGTTIGRDGDNVTIQFVFTNLQTTSATFSIAIAGNLSLGDGDLPRVDLARYYGFDVRTSDRHILWDTLGSGYTGWIGEPYPGLGTVGDAGFRSGTASPYLTMLTPHAGRTYFSVAVAASSSANVTINVSGRAVCPPPIVTLDSYPTAVTLLARDRVAAIGFHAVGIVGQVYSFTVFGTDTSRAAQSYTFATVAGYTIASAGGSGGAYGQTYASSAPVGTYALHLYVADSAGGAVLHRDFALIELLNLVEPEARASAQPTATREKTAQPVPTPAGPPLPTDVALTASFAIRRVRVRKVFRVSYLLPVIAQQ